ncbi:MAG: hypothetical protein GXX85_15365 [Ignavibacteria bacterium]|nr:hypothetical protein [Ignavibacteria bacterium]
MKLILLIIVSLLSVAKLPAQNPITPNGKEVLTVSMSHLLPWEIISINQQMEYNYPEVYPIQFPVPDFGLFNCHFFAWNNNQGYTIWTGTADIWKNGEPTEYKWFNYPTDYFTDASYSTPSGYSSYVQSTSSTAPIAVYRNSGVITHSARRLSNSSSLISKWGQWGIYYHQPNEVPLAYGSVTENYEINPNYRPVGDGDPGGRDWETIPAAISGIPSGGIIPVLSGSQTLNSNVTIPSGVVLSINSGAMVNFNGYSLTSTGGTISIQSGGRVTLNSATFPEGSGSGITYEINGINVGATFNGIGQTIKANTTSDWSFYQWSDGNTSNPRTITSTVNIYAKYKGIQKSDDPLAYTNNSQRKIVKTADGWLHQVYQSMGHVFIEHSSNNGTSWVIGNNGQPLDNGEGKCPRATILI